MAEPVIIKFTGSIAQSKNAISFGSNDRIRVQFDIPENQIEAANQLTGLRNCVLNVTVEVEQDEQKIQGAISSW